MLFKEPNGLQHNQHTTSDDLCGKLSSVDDKYCLSCGEEILIIRTNERNEPTQTHTDNAF